MKNRKREKGDFITPDKKQSFLTSEATTLNEVHAGRILQGDLQQLQRQGMGYPENEFATPVKHLTFSTPRHISNNNSQNKDKSGLKSITSCKESFMLHPSKKSLNIVFPNFTLSDILKIENSTILMKTLLKLAEGPEVQ